MIANLDAAQLKEYLHYNPETGDFTWIKSTTNRIKVGDVAQNVNHGYIRIQLLGKRYLAHRLAFLYMTNEFPKGLVDHVNCNGLDNRWTNIREATHSQNNQNRTIRKTNSSGYRNVYYSPQHKGWRTGIVVNGKRQFLGVYKTPLEASLIYEDNAKKIHGDFYYKGEEHDM